MKEEKKSKRERSRKERFTVNFELTSRRLDQDMVFDLIERLGDIRGVNIRSVEVVILPSKKKKK